MNVSCVPRGVERRRAATSRHVAVPAWSGCLVMWCPIEQASYGGPDQLDVTDLLGGNGLDQVLIWGGGAAEIDALEEVLHHRPHLAELAT
jgi:hypothetical protein